nr:protein SIEVE ELEMENT OCCLUSION B-like [Ipomoea batatas]
MERIAANHNAVVPAAQPRVQPLARRAPPLFSLSDDHAIVKKIQDTHSPDGRDVDANIILQIIEEIFQHAYPGVEGVLQGTQGATIPGAQPVANIEKLEVKASLAVDGVLEGLAYITHKVSCEVTTKLIFSLLLIFN